MPPRPADSESGYSDVDRAADPLEYVHRLDGVGATGFWQAIKLRTFALLAPQVGDRVLDVGCGTGDDVRALARLVGPSGCVVGLDFSAMMIAEARRRAADTGLPVEYVQGDAHALDFPSATFDACRAERVLQHLYNPRRVLEEMVRVGRPGARVATVEPDHAALTITGADPAITRRIVATRVGHFRSGRIGRDLPRLFREVGLQDVGVTLLHTTSVDCAQDTRSGVLDKYATDAEVAGTITAEERAAWLAALREAGQTGRYRQTLVVFLVSGTKL